MGSHRAEQGMETALLDSDAKRQGTVDWSHRTASQPTAFWCLHLRTTAALLPRGIPHRQDPRIEGRVCVDSAAQEGELRASFPA